MIKLETLKCSATSPIPLIQYENGKYSCEYTLANKTEPREIIKQIGVERIIEQTRSNTDIIIAQVIPYTKKDMRGWENPNEKLNKLNSDFLLYKNEFNGYYPLVQTIPWGIRELVENEKTPIAVKIGEEIFIYNLSGIKGISQKNLKIINTHIIEKSNLEKNLLFENLANLEQENQEECEFIEGGGDPEEAEVEKSLIIKKTNPRLSNQSAPDKNCPW